MTVATLPYAYHVIADEDSNPKSPSEQFLNHRGYEVEMLEIASKIMKFNYKLVNPVDLVRGTLSTNNGTVKWNGVMKCLLEVNGCDMAIGSMIITHSRIQVVTHTYPFDYEVFTFATGLPKKVEDLATR